MTDKSQPLRLFEVPSSPTPRTGRYLAAPGVRLWRGDNLRVMQALPSESFDLIYIDPPYATGKVFRAGEGVGFRDRFGIRSKRLTAERWLDHLAPRLVEIARLLRPGGTLWIHVDPRVSPYVRLFLDDVLGEEAFRNEVVWCYNGGAVPQKDFPRKHDVLLRYVKPGRPHTFHVVRRPYKENTQMVGRHSTRAREIAIDLERGTPITDWWTDIATVTGWSPERTGFQTQKPLALLRRILETTSNPGDLVGDFYCGSGTTLLAALQLKRKAVGVDRSAQAFAIAARRLSAFISRGGTRHADRPPDAR